MKKIIPVSLVITLIASGAALAQTASLHEGHFNALDGNKDGKISKTEYSAVMGQAFDQLDTNRNGSLASAETSKVLSPEQFAQVDADKNGRLTREEFLDHVTREFDQHDKDKDGHLQK